MKKIYILIALFFTVPCFAKAITLNQSTDTVSVYTLYGGAWLGIAPDQKVNMTVDGYSLSTTSEADGATFSKVTLPANFVGKIISQAEVINWISGGKVYHCNADNLPLIVMNGNDFNSSTKIHFDCQVVGP